MSKLHRTNKDRDTLDKIISALKKVGFEKLVILSNIDSHTYAQCRIKNIGKAVKIDTEGGEVLISMNNIKGINLSYRNAVCIFETFEVEEGEYRAENWFLMNPSQYREFLQRKRF